MEPPQQSLLQVPPQQLKPPDGRCPQGTGPIGRYRCVRVAGQPPSQIVQPPPPVRPPSPPPVGCSGDLVRTAQGGCTCPLGTTLQGRDRCVLVSVPSPPPPMVRPPPLLPPIAPPPPTTSVRCSEGMVPTSDGRCRCPQGTVLRAGRCLRVSGPLLPPPAPPPLASTICPDGTRVPRGMPCPAPKPAGVRCPDGSLAQHIALCRKRCPDGSLVLQGQRCPVRPQPKPRSCPSGYRTLSTPNKYGAYCELIPVPTPPRPKPETRRCPPGWIGHFPRCRRPATCGKGMEGTPPKCFPIVK
jgi:hypothetical protein